ncbi:MAG: S49 family peptidase [Bacteroidota bacterium]
MDAKTLFDPSQLHAILPGYLTGAISAVDRVAEAEIKARSQELNRPSFLTVDASLNWENVEAKDFEPLTLDVSKPLAAQIPVSERLESVAVVPLKGVMRKYGFSFRHYSTSTTELRQTLAMCKASGVMACVMDFDSGGGQVDGNFLLAQDVKNYIKAGFPILGNVNGVAASAAYQIAAQTMKLYTASPTDHVGSIGVFMTHVSYEKALENEGIEITYIIADGGENKVVAPSTQNLTEADIAKIKNQINPLRSIMVNQIKEGRGDRLMEVEGETFSGSIFNSRQAKAHGLIDGTKSLEQTALEAFRIAKRMQVEGHGHGGKKKKKKASTTVPQIKGEDSPKSPNKFSKMNKFFADLAQITGASVSGSNTYEGDQILTPEDQKNTIAAFDSKLKAANKATQTAKEQAADWKQKYEAKITDLQGELDTAQASKGQDVTKERLQTLEATETEYNNLKSDFEKLPEEFETVEALVASYNTLKGEKETAEGKVTTLESDYQNLEASYNEMAEAYGKPKYVKEEAEEGQGAGADGSTDDILDYVNLNDFFKSESTFQ